MFKRAWVYVVTVWMVYKTHVSGWLLAIVAIGLNVAAAYFSRDPSASAEVVKWSARLTGIGAIYLIFVAQYDAWTREHDRAEKAEGRLRPRMKVGNLQQQFWGLEENRGSSGMGYYFQVFNLGEGECLQSVKAELISIEPDEVKILPLPLHIRHNDYKTVETCINPGSSAGFDIATGPDHNSISQQGIRIPCIVGGDRGWVNAAPVPDARYHLIIRISARNCPFEDAEFDLWIDGNFLRCVARRISGEKVL